MNKKIHLVIFIFFSSGFQLLFSQAFENILDARTDLSPHIEILEDDGHNYSIEELLSGKLDSLFVPNRMRDNSTRRQNVSVWARIRIKTSASKISSWVLKT